MIELLCMGNDFDFVDFGANIGGFVLYRLLVSTHVGSLELQHREAKMQIHR